MLRKLPTVREIGLDHLEAADICRAPGKAQARQAAYRSCSGNTIGDSLANWAGCAISAAKEGGTMYTDPWKSSLEYLGKIGEAAACKLDPGTGNNTHLNSHGVLHRVWQECIY
ncbi:hypothetical protein HOY80DRAFT_1059152 [Tuber brumale]|nr:hypothetical protein HOY80DRAFT_1059152 [Tuber brumale]